MRAPELAAGDGRMVLFADDTTTAAGASMIACLLAALNGLFAWLSRRDQLTSDRETARDKLQHDARVVQQAAEITILKGQHEECEANHVEMKREVADLRQQIKDLSGLHRPLPTP